MSVLSKHLLSLLHQQEEQSWVLCPSPVFSPSICAHQSWTLGGGGPWLISVSKSLALGFSSTHLLASAKTARLRAACSSPAPSLLGAGCLSPLYLLLARGGLPRSQLGKVFQTKPKEQMFSNVLPPTPCLIQPFIHTCS